MQKYPSVYANENDEDEALQQKKMQVYQTYMRPINAQEVHFYISSDIREPRLYTDMIHTISTASENDIIFIHLNTPGGDLSTGVQIINAMQNSQARIITILEGQCYSLGTLIFLASDEMMVNDHCMMMFHTFRGGVLGKGHEQVAELEATVKWFTMLAKRIYIPFLSEAEFDRITRGEDLWMHTPEIRKRLERMIREVDQPTTTKAKRSPKQTKDQSNEEPEPVAPEPPKRGRRKSVDASK